MTAFERQAACNMIFLHSMQAQAGTRLHFLQSAHALERCICIRNMQDAHVAFKVKRTFSAIFHDMYTVCVFPVYTVCETKAPIKVTAIQNHLKCLS